MYFNIDDPEMIRSLMLASNQEFLKVQNFPLIYSLIYL